MSDVLGIGIVGAGSIAVRGIMPHLAMYDVQDRVHMTAVVDPVEGRAEAAAERFGIDAAYQSYDDLLADPKVDAVSIASPIGLHYEQGKKALEAGKHIHFNKTMTTTVAEATELVDLAKKKNLKIVASPGEMLRPHNQRIKEAIQNGELGQLVWTAHGSAFGTYHEDEKVRQGDDVLSNINPAWYFRKPGGGPLYDMTVYSLHAMTGVMGPAKRVTAFSGTRVKEREFRGEKIKTDADDNTLMVLDFGDSLFAFIYGVAAGRVTSGYFGTKGSITAEGRTGWMMNGEPLDYPGAKEARETGRSGNQFLLPHVTGPHRAEGTQEHHVFEDVMQLVDLVREGKPTPSTPEHARHVIDIIESAYRSSETGQAQELKTTF